MEFVPCIITMNLKQRHTILTNFLFCSHIGWQTAEVFLMVSDCIKPYAFLFLPLQCSLACHKKCLETLAIQCGHKKLHGRLHLFGVEFAQAAKNVPDGIPFIIKKCTSEIESRALNVKVCSSLFMFMFDTVLKKKKNEDFNAVSIICVLQLPFKLKQSCAGLLILGYLSSEWSQIKS